MADDMSENSVEMFSKTEPSSATTIDANLRLASRERNLCCLFDHFRDVVGEPVPHHRSTEFLNTQDQLFTTARNEKLSKKFARREVLESSHECGERWHNLHDKLRQAIQPYAQRNGEELEMCSCCAWLFCDERVVSLAHRCHALMGMKLRARGQPESYPVGV